MTLQEQLRKKVAEWRAEADRMTLEGDNADDEESRVWCYGHAERFEYCADDLEAILTAEPQADALLRGQSDEGARDAARKDAYDMVDHYLRNSLMDSDYAEYSEALDVACGYSDAAMSAQAM